MWPSLSGIFLGPLGDAKSNEVAPEGVFQREKLSRKHNQPRLIKKGKVEGAW